MIEPVLEFRKGKPLYVQLYNHIKAGIEAGKIPPHDKIPSIRQAARELQLSRTTVENAYSQLSLEGYIYSKNKSGYYVCDMGEDFLGISGKNAAEKENRDYGYEKAEEYVDKDNFNLCLWRKYYSRVLSGKGNRLFLGAEPQGEFELRKQISSYVYRARGVDCNPESIVIGAGVQVLLGILLVIMREKGLGKVAFEEPGFTDVRHIFRDYGFDIFPVSVGESGLDIGALKQSGAQICYVSPTHQYPTGLVMPVSKRIQLLGWAGKNKAYIIEDDYDSELRYSGRPVPSLRSLDMTGRVVYLGCFSTVLMPSLRISYMVLPSGLAGEYAEMKHRYNQTVSKIEQLALAFFMKEGEFERHLRRVKKRYASRYERFRRILNDRLDDSPVKVGSPDSGTGILLSTGEPEATEGMVRTMQEEGLPVKFVKNDLFIFVYCSMPENKMEKALNRFMDILGKHVMKLNC